MATQGMRVNMLWAILLLGLASVGAAVLALPGCSQPPEGLDADTATVEINGRTFHLEIADTQNARVQGLSDRTFIDDDGGMLFVFTRADKRYFVMRRCPIPIDIIFLDASGRVVATHQMKEEEPQGENESDAQYEDRLKRYPSRFAAQFAIELQGGMLDNLDVKEGQVIELDLDALKRRAK